MPLFNSIRRKKSLYLLASVIILIFIFSSPHFSFPKLTLVNLIKLPIYLVNVVISEARNLVFYRANSREATKFKKENDILTQKLIKFRELSLENERLNALLSFKKKSKFSLIPARVVARDSANWTKSLLINKGSSDDIKVSQLVITDLGLVGKIFEISKNTSRVMLITDPNLNIAAITQRSRETGIVSGSLLGKCVMRYLTADSDIKIGDILLTLGLGSGHPKGIIIGEIISWHSEGDGVSYSAIVRPKVRLPTLEEVLVVNRAR